MCILMHIECRLLMHCKMKYIVLGSYSFFIKNNKKTDRINIKIVILFKLDRVIMWPTTWLIIILKKKFDGVSLRPLGWFQNRIGFIMVNSRWAIYVYFISGSVRRHISESRPHLISRSKDYTQGFQRYTSYRYTVKKGDA